MCVDDARVDGPSPIGYNASLARAEIFARPLFDK
jgi:hypothetical protein